VDGAVEASRYVSEVSDGAAVVTELIQMATGQITHKALESEQADFIGHSPYEREQRHDYRSGYEPG
jgi:hypothetical protein